MENGPDDDTGAPPPARRPYVAPELTRIELRREEAVLGACKTMTSGGVGNAGTCDLCSTSGS